MLGPIAPVRVQAMSYFSSLISEIQKGKVWIFKI